MALDDGNTSLRGFHPVAASHFDGRKIVLIVTLCAAFFLPLDIALADSLNGKWCTKDGRQYEISFEIVTLSDGFDVFGDYDRHHFVFRLPPNVNLGGATVDLVLVNRDVAFARYLTKSGLEIYSEPEKWTRCASGVS